MDWFVSLFPVWMPDQLVYSLLGVFVAGCAVILFPPRVLGGSDDES